MSFVSGPISFTGTFNTELSAVIAAFSKQTSFAENIVIGQNGASVICTAAADFGCYQHSGSPASADYSVFGNITREAGATDPLFGVCGRMQSGAGTFYALLQKCSTNELILYEFVAGSSTPIGTAYSNTLTGTPQTLELRMAGNQISGYLDGVLRIGPVTNGTITTAGKPGLMGRAMRELGVADSGRLTAFDAIDAGGGGSSSLPIFTNQHRRR